LQKKILELAAKFSTYGVNGSDGSSTAATNASILVFKTINKVP